MLAHQIGGRYLAMQVVGAHELWPRLVKMLERPELLDDARFATPVGRRQHWSDLRAYIVLWLDRFETVEAALAALTAARIPCAPVLSPAEVAASPHLAARGALPGVPHPTHGDVRVIGSPFQVDGAPVGPTGPAPYRPGEHTRAVLGEILGYAPARIDDLYRLGAISGPGPGGEPSR